ncbi:MAG: RyR domain-containing protein [Candidimonas sp.]
MEITLKLPTKPSKKLIRQFRRIVKSYGPLNVISSFQERNDDGHVKEVFVILRKYNDDTYEVVIPLKRHLVSSEIEKITHAWDAYYPSGDFIIFGSKEIKNISSEDDSIVVPDTTYDDLCLALAKSQHRIWYNERVKQGWRYGEKVSFRDKTHPMLRPWSDLPKKYQTVDKTTPQVFIDELNRMGFVIKKEK